MKLFTPVFNLEKRNHSNKYITKLRVENRTLSSSYENINEEHRYYKRHKRLYSSHTNPNDPRFDVFFDSSTLSNCLYIKLTAATVF